MRIMEFIQTALRLSWHYFAKSFKSTDEQSLLEDDPVGEFLDRRKGGIVLDDDEAVKPHPMTDGAPLGLEAKVEVKGSSDNAVAEAQPGQKQTQVSSEAVSTEDDPSVVPPIAKEKKEIVVAVPEESGEEIKVALVAKDEPQALKPDTQEVEAANPPQQKGTQDSVNPDSLLEIFKSEENPLDPLGSLAKELLDMSIYSLLEETKQIAAKMKFKKGREE
jgi:hypothetical protein